MERIIGFFVDHGYTLELTFSFALFARFFKPKSHFWLRLAVSYLALLAFSIFWKYLNLPINFGTQMAKYLTMYIIAAVSVPFRNVTNTFSTIFVSACGVAMQHAVFVFYTIILEISGFDFDSVFSAVANPFLVVVGYCVISYVFYAKFKDVPPEKFESKSNIIMGVVIVLMSIGLYLLVEYSGVRQNEPFLYMLYAFYDITCSGLALVLEYNIVVGRKLIDDNEILEYLVYKQEEQYKTLKDNMELVNIKCHDMKQQISLFENRMDPGAMEEIKDLIKVFEVNYKTGNEVLDAFFAEKSLVLEKRDIEFNCIADGQAIDFMSPSEIYTLFGNAFDNAVDALSRVKEKNKLLSISVKEKLGMVIIHFENTYNADDLRLEDGMPVTTKDNRDYHGYGLRSIKLIAEKYGGTVSVEPRDGVFNLNVMIPIPNKPNS